MLWSKKQLVQTPFATPDEQRRAKQLIYILRVLLLVIAVANIAIIIIDRQIWVQLLLLNIFFPFGGAIYWLVHRGMLRQANILLIGLWWLVLTVFVFWTDGTQGAAFYSYTIVIIAAGLLLGPKVETAVLLLSLAVATFVFVNTVQQWLPIPFATSSPAAIWVGASLCLVMVSYVVRLTLADLRWALRQQRQIATQNVRLREQAEQQAYELAQANAKLQELDALKSKFVRDMTHELRTPLTNFKLYLDLWELAGEEKKERYLQVLKEQNGRLTHLVDAILRIAKLDAGEELGEVRELALNDVARKVADAYEGRLKGKGLTVQLALTDNLPVVCVARPMLIEVADQLMSNAIAYSLQGTITLRTFLSSDGEAVCLQVADEGIGIPEEDMDKLFDRFYRGTNVGELSTAGAGLGLTIARRIVGFYDGTLEATSKLGEGSVFTICLPLQPNRC
ncbi:MAG: HAMP domain-containing histidine kinase [Anaerolineales bacterium]|nr:HAMP domain-containing histidine kinase [Anaerolineales bacterium]